MDSLPRLDECLSLYQTVWERFEEESFTVAKLTHREPADEPDAFDIDGDERRCSLDLLTAYGLLERDSTDRYRVRCRPGESLEDWRRKSESPLEIVHRELRYRRDGASDGHHADHLHHRGEHYVSVRLDEDVPTETAVETIVEATTRAPNASGVAVRSPAALAGRVQRLADRLCDADPTDGDTTFEKVTANVVGEHKDALEYRLYLRTQT